MPSLCSINEKDNQTTWEKLHKSLLSQNVDTISFDKIGYYVRCTTGLEFQPGTTINRIIRELASHKFITVDNRNEKITVIKIHKKKSTR